MWICMCGHTQDVVRPTYSKFHRNRFRGFGATRGRNLPFSITLAIGFYNSLYYRTSRHMYRPIADACLFYHIYFCHCMFLSRPINSAFNYVSLPMLHIRLLCVNKNLLLTYLLTYRSLKVKWARFFRLFVPIDKWKFILYSQSAPGHVHLLLHYLFCKI